MEKVYQQLHTFIGKKVKMVGLVSLSILAVMLLQASIVSAASAPQATTIYYACVNNTSGAITIVSKTTKCSTGTHKIHWNQKGPIGPQGPQGIQGVQGIQGPQGPQGPSGVSQGYFTPAGNVNIVTSNQSLVPVVTTAPLQASGYYLVTASETAIFANGDTVACIITTVSGQEGSFFAVYGPSTAYQYVNMNVTDKISANAGDQIQLSCAEYNNNATTISYNAGISVIQLTTVSSSAIPHKNGHLPLPKVMSHK